jgi:short-subunit dehydrogenase
MTYEQSSILITGASQGIGRSISIAFAAASERPLLLLARNKKNLLETRELCMQAGAGRVEILTADASDEKDLSRLLLPGDFPEPGLIINNAGSFLFKPVTETTRDEFEHQININLFTAVNMVNRFLPNLKQLDRALIINICSVGALRGLADSGAYSSAKHALLGYTRSLRDELQDTNIGVTAINLGQTHSPSWDESTMSPDRLVNPSDVASLLVAIASLSPRSLVEEIVIQPQHGRVPPM